MLSLNQVSLQIGSRILFDDVSLVLKKGRRYGIVGANGAGKSTLLRLLSREDEPTLGEVAVPKSARLGWLKQDQYLFDDETILNVVLRGRPELWQALRDKEKVLAEPVWTDELAHQTAEIEEVIARMDGYAAEAYASQLLVGLGIGEELHEKPLRVLSGGYKLRVLLARTLFDNPDILLLDEPTNYLDIVTIAWLERFVSDQFSGLAVVVSHDRDFLNRLSTDILDIDYGEVRHYEGNYDAFEKQKAFIVEQRAKEREQAEKKVAHMQRFVERFGAKATKARQANSRKKMIEKMEWPDTLHSSRVAPNFRFKQKRDSGKKVLEVQGLSKAYGDKIVLFDVDFTIYRGDHVAIIGPNGIGKSTLLKAVLERVGIDDGEFSWGHATSVGYFAQEHHDLIKEKATIWEWITNHVVDEEDWRLREVLGQMLFTKDDIYKNVMTISGGEAARVIFGLLTVQEHNVLVLDEPTNHLDLEAREALADALHAFPGTVIVVSHDRHFVSKVGTRILSIQREGVIDFLGTYPEYVDKYASDLLKDPQ